MNLPDEIDGLRERVVKALDPIASAVEKGTKAEKDLFFFIKMIPCKLLYLQKETYMRQKECM